MTLLEINLTDVLLETDPDDKVVVWAPVMREGPAGQLVGPRRKSIPLTDGVGSDEVVPGPLMVQVQCKAMSDARPREVVVPEEGPVTLTGLLDSAGAFTYSPAVVGQVAQMRDDAEAARDVSMEAAAAATTAVTNVETQLSGYVASAEDAADSAENAAAVAFTEDPAGSGLYTFPTTAGD